MRVTFYGRLADSIGREIEVDVPAPVAVAEVRQRLTELHPEAGVASGRVRAVVDGSIVPDSFIVGPGQQVELLAPLSGG